MRCHDGHAVARGEGRFHVDDVRYWRKPAFARRLERQCASDATGKSVAVVAGTTSEAALKNAITKNLIDAKVVSVASREEAMKQLDAGQVAAFASTRSC